MPGRRWKVDLGAAAATDFGSIVRWTTERFGAPQTRDYRRTLLAAIEALRDGPAIVGSKARDEIQPGLRSLHVARGGRRGRHFLLYRAVAGDAIVVGRILHDSMDLATHGGFAGDLRANEGNGDSIDG